MGDPTLKKRSSPLGSSPGRPVPIGVSVKTKIELAGKQQPLFEVYNLEVTLLEILRGKDAWSRIETENGPSLLPAPGFEYILARVKFGYFRQSRVKYDAMPYTIKLGQFASASPDGKTEYENPGSVKPPDPVLIDMPFSTGDSRDGWIVLQVPQDMEKPLLVFHRQQSVDTSYSVSGGLWFKLYEFDPMCLDDSCPVCR
jgi:hypothetical protein